MKHTFTINFQNSAIFEYNKEDIISQHKVTKQELAALEILKSTGLPVLEAALLAKEALTAGRGRLKRTQRCIAAGKSELEKQEKTVSFEKATRAALEDRKGRRKRTLTDFRYYTKRFTKRCNGLANRRMRSITATECAEYIETAFDTPRQRQKARMILSGVFSTAIKRGWCSDNPVRCVEAPHVLEKRLPILSEKEIITLLKTAKEYQNGSCLPAVGMMLYAGIRPHEVARLTWAEVDLKRGFISILPRHSKTGGARRVTIYPPLAKILRQYRKEHHERICPARWSHHWQQLHKLQESPWRQDVLRHTYASYHLEHFHSYEQLQYEIGHRSSTLLRTRYVDMSRVGCSKGFFTQIPSKVL